MSWGGIRTGLARLAARDNDLYEYLVTGRRLRLAFADAQLDCIDFHSAHFVAAAIERRASLCILHPDSSPRRSAFLFAYALLSQWQKTKRLNAGVPRGILYCGTQTGIRDQLAKVSVSGLGSSLADVFSQSNLSRGKSAGDSHSVTGLPPVTTAYSPTDPEMLIETVNPSWIALDFGDDSFLPWLSGLVNMARTRKIPILAWGTNPLSNAIQALGENTELVQWPFGRTFFERSLNTTEANPELLFHPYIVTETTPFLINSSFCSIDYTNGLRKAASALNQTRSAALSSFSQKACQRYWRLYRTLETLHVPLSLHEAEVPRIWGLDSIQRQFDICEHFQTLLEGSRSPLARHTAVAIEALKEVQEFLTVNAPPIWRALVTLVQNEADKDQARVLVLPTRGKKALLEIAILAKLGLTVDDLARSRIWLASVDELETYSGYAEGRGSENDLIPRRYSLVPHFIGIPTAAQTTKIWPMFLGENAVLLAHDFQLSALKQRINSCNTKMSPDLTRFSRALTHLVPFPPGEDVLVTKPRVQLDKPQFIKLEPLKAVVRSEDGVQAAITPSFELADEVGRLLVDEDDVGLSDESISSESQSDARSETWLQEAIEIRFTEGWIGQFDPRQPLNFINKHDLRCDPRSARALRVGDSVVIVPYQRRQSLYAMILARVHRHPAIEIHLALLRRWRDDLLSGYARWSLAKRNSWVTEKEISEKFLRELQIKGSSISSSQAIHFWFNGAVLAPLDQEDILRVGQVLQVQFLEQQYKRIGAAASRIRGLHRGLSNRLNHWLADRATGTDRTQDNEIIDHETGLTFGDIRSSLVIADVLSSRTVQGPFLPSMLGYIDKGDAVV